MVESYIRGRMMRAKTDFLSLLSLEGLDSTKCLLIRTNADEATSGLGAVQILLTAVHMIFGWFIRMLQIIAPPLVSFDSPPGQISTIASKAVRFSLIMSGIVIPGVHLVYITFRLIYQVAPMFHLAVLEDVALLIWTIAAFPAILVVVLTIVFVFLIAALMTILAACFGGQDILAYFFVQLSVEASPPGNWAIVQLDVKDESKRWATGDAVTLAHSRAYEDQRAFKIMANWINALS